jgi:hypothetical protein
VEEVASQLRDILRPPHVPALAFPAAELPADQLAQIMCQYGQVEDVYPLAATQEAILTHELVAETGELYLVQNAWLLHGVTVETVARAWRDLVAMQPMLRTAIVWDDVDHPVQVVSRSVATPLEVFDRAFRGDAHAAARAHLRERRRAALPLTAPSLTRMSVLRSGQADGLILAWEFHHVLLDGWSMALLWTEFLRLIAQHRAGVVPELVPPASYRAFVSWIHDRTGRAEYEQWRRYLAGFRQPTPLPLPAPALPSEGSADHFGSLVADVSRRVLDRARILRVTPSTMVQAAWALTLRPAAGGDALFGVTLAGRPEQLRGSESMIGMFINTVPLLVSFPGGMTADAWLRGLQAEAGTMADARWMPLRHILSAAEVPRRQALFETILVHQNYPQIRLDGLVDAEPLLSIDPTRFPITLITWIDEDSVLRWRLAVDRSRVDEALVGELSERFHDALTALADGEGRPVTDLSAAVSRYH